MKELIKEVEVAMESLKDYNKFKHLYSDDGAERELAELRRTLGTISNRLKLSSVRKVEHPSNKAYETAGSRQGKMVRIRPCAKECEDKTYLGILIGEIASSSKMRILDKDTIQVDFCRHNPAIFVPKLGKVIFGYESWWGVIKTEDDLKSITNKNIQDVWYVKMLNELNKQSDE